MENPGVVSADGNSTFSELEYFFGVAKDGLHLRGGGENLFCPLAVIVIIVAEAFEHP